MVNPLRVYIVLFLQIPTKIQLMYCERYNYIQTDGTAQGTHMSCSCSDIAMAVYDEKAMNQP